MNFVRQACCLPDKSNTKKNCPSWRLPALILRRLSEAATGGKNKMADTDKIVEQLSSLSVLEIAGLVKQLEEKWGVSAAAPVAVAAGPGAGAPRRGARPRGASRSRGGTRCGGSRRSSSASSRGENHV